jgi:hypothetical protein
LIKSNRVEAGVSPPPTAPTTPNYNESLITSCSLLIPLSSAIAPSQKKGDRLSVSGGEFCFVIIFVMSNNWLFDQPPNCAVITLRQIMNGEQPILYISHDSDDGGWQFLSQETPEVEDCILVSLKRIVEHDSSVLAVANLPLGWCAERASIQESWRRFPNPTAES